MNKTKKIAIAAVSLVMAGTMAFGIVGCGGTKDTWDVKTDENGKLTYAEGVTLNLNIGNQNNSSKQGIAFNTTDLSGATKLPDGVSYTAGDLKPAWAALGKTLKVSLNDAFQNLSSNNQITTPVTNKNMADYDLISGSLQAIVENSDSFLNLAEYLDYMPNYKAFLNANPVTRYSLTGNGSTGAMYAAPYFDGNDDIEKYTMVNYNLVTKVLDNDYAETTTYKQQLEAKKTDWPTTTDAGLALGAETTKAYAEAYMTEDYEIATTNPSDETKTVTVKVDHTAAKTAALDSSTPLGDAIAKAAGKAYTGDSGNIVDLQNFAINEKEGEVSGAQLAKILREYIKVAYKIGDNAAYTKLSDVFLSASAAWDVDLFVALSRCVVTDTVEIKDKDGKVTGYDRKQYAITGRETTTQRRVDLMAFAGELYGVRGLESRYEYAYFDNAGQLQDTRLDAKTYELLSNMSNLTKEGLVYVGGLTKDKDGKDVKTSVDTSKTSGDRTMALHDYVQTQTKPGISTTDKAKYNFAPIVNAVSKWDVDGDGNRTDIMRFTESWRSVKNTGFCVPKDAVKNNPEKLSAVLTLIDYMFSNDGQILLSYGPQSTKGNAADADGWWYAVDASTVAEVKDTYTLANVATKVADAYGNVPAQYEVKKEYRDKCFVYQGKVWGGMPYNGRQIPVVTDLNNDFYKGDKITVGGAEIKQDSGNIKIKQIGNYTNYARYFIGSTLPVGNKDQGYEYQATAPCGIEGAATVTVALLNGTLKHVKLTLETGESPWYLIVPTALPLTKGDQDTLKSDPNQTNISGRYFYNNSSVSQITNIAIDMVYYGLGSSAKPCGRQDILGGSYADSKTGASIVTWLEGVGMPQRRTIMRTGWSLLNDYYKLGYNV